MKNKYGHQDSKHESLLNSGQPEFVDVFGSINQGADGINTTLQESEGDLNEDE